MYNLFGITQFIRNSEYFIRMNIVTEACIVGALYQQTGRPDSDPVFLKVGGTAPLWALGRIRGAVASSSKMGGRWGALNKNRGR